MKKQIIALSASIILLTTSLLAGPPPGWMRTYGGHRGDSGDWIIVLPDSGYLISGTMMFETIGISIRGTLIRTDPYGNVLWLRNYIPYEGATNSCRLRCVQQTDDSGYVAVGYGLALIPEGFSHDLWILKVDSGGLVQWSKWYGTDVGEDGESICLAHDGGYVITGDRDVDDKPDLWVVRVDSIGDTLWTLTLGGDDRNYGLCVQPTSDGNYIVSGWRDLQYSWLLKISDQGEVLWDKVYNELLGKAQSVVETSDGGFVFAGEHMTSNITSDLLIAKTDSDGDLLWSRRYAENPSLMNYAFCIQETSDSGFIVCGCKNQIPFGGNEGWLLKTDEIGDTTWTQTFVYNPMYENSLKGVQQSLDGGYIVVGQTGWGDLPNSFDIWLVKTDSLGCVPIVEDQIEVESNIDTSTPIGKPVQIRYTDLPGGFHAYVYDSIGRKVDEIHNANASGTITWGECYGPGVYFIKPVTGNAPATKVILTR